MIYLKAQMGLVATPLANVSPIPDPPSFVERGGYGGES